EKPATEKSATEKPATEKPATEKPATEKPATEKPVARSEAAAAHGEHWAIVLVSTGSRAGAEQMLAMYAKRGIKARIAKVSIKGKTWFRVLIPGFANRQQARNRQVQLRKDYGIKDTWLTRDHSPRKTVPTPRRQADGESGIERFWQPFPDIPAE
ncbi:MAG: hypothetical protein D6678_03820, partial [Zetaproteobacteria bacterium]